MLNQSHLEFAGNDNCGAECEATLRRRLKLRTVSPTRARASAQLASVCRSEAVLGAVDSTLRTRSPWCSRLRSRATSFSMSASPNAPAQPPPVAGSLSCWYKRKVVDDFRRSATNEGGFVRECQQFVSALTHPQPFRRCRPGDSETMSFAGPPTGKQLNNNEVVMNSRTFEWDAFLSHSRCDKDCVRDIAARLADDGIRVWFDEWTIQPGENIPAAIEDGLQRSRLVLLFVSRDALESDWVSLERQTATFRDPLNKAQRFIPIKLDEAMPPDTLRSFRHIDWESDDSYEEIRNACAGGEARIAEVTYHNVFTPGAPPTNPKLLVGRDETAQELIDYLKSPGIHPIVIGPRGIGKTSLVRAAIRSVQQPNISVLEANTVGSFDQLCKQICEDLHVDTEDAQFTPASFLRTLQSARQHAVVSIDELDDLPDDCDITEKLAKFAKAASNQSENMQQKFVFSGISNDAHNLFGGHLSSLRNHPVIYLDRIKVGDIKTFLNVACETLGVRLPNVVVNEIASDADGFPYYVHQVGFHTLACFDRDTRASEVTRSHFEEGKRRASDSAFSHYLLRYKRTIYRLGDVERSILRTLVLSKRRNNDYDELESSVVTDRKTTVAKVKASFRRLREDGYITYRKSDRTVAIAAPLLKPFLRIKLKLKQESDRTAQKRLF